MTVLLSMPLITIGINTVMISDAIINRYRKIDLYDYLIGAEPDNWIIGPKYLTNKAHDSLVVTKGKGWVWNSQGLRGGSNPIDYLCDYYNISFKEAVQIIAKSKTSYNLSDAYKTTSRCTTLPIKIYDKDYIIYNYLCKQRALNPQIVKMLIMQNKIYLTQNDKYYNICFFNPNNYHYQITGITTSKYKCCSDGKHCWWFGCKKKLKAYICESPIDAISLYQLLQENDAMYISLGGCWSRRSLIKKIANYFKETILAIDNDNAGNITADAYPILQRIVPKNKDWNQDLINLSKQK